MDLFKTISNKDFNNVSEYELLYYATGYLIDKMVFFKEVLSSDSYTDTVKKKIKDLLDLYQKQYDELHSLMYPLSKKEFD